MKTTKINATILAAACSLLFFSCQRDAHEGIRQTAATEEMVVDADAKKAPGECNPNAYTVTLESNANTGNGWDWIWSIQNNNPGNGSNGTAQDLSHWSFQLGNCVNTSHITGAAYSYNGTDWITFTPTVAVDGSQDCVSAPVLKFDAGTTGTAKTYYRLTVSQFYPVSGSLGYYKSGSTTCCSFLFFGIGCGNSEEEREIVE